MLLQREVRRVLASKKWSLMGAEIQTGISSGTINRMKKGLNVAPRFVVEFGVKAGEPAGRWELVALGRDPDSEPYRSPAAENQRWQSVAESRPDLTREYDPSVPPTIHFYGGLSDESKAQSDQFVKHLYELEKRGVIGGKVAD